MNASSEDERWRRFLDPRHALAKYVSIHWQGAGMADTPAEDAWCRIWLARPGDHTGWQAAFQAFGPPVVIACADWLCEQIEVGGLDTHLPTRLEDTMVDNLSKTLALAAGERYAALLVLDALASAHANLGT